jgi:mRNA-degrading endonuclease RelE of RelBE toxin-antitoxin system
MSYNVFFIPSFERDVKTLQKKYKSLKSDLTNLVVSLQTEPFQGKPLGKGCYKIRMAITSKGKGKSGGARVITCVKITSENIFLLSMYDKSEMTNISEKALNELLSQI